MSEPTSWNYQAVAGSIYGGTLARTMPAGVRRVQDQSASIDWTSLHLIEPLSLRVQVLHAVAVAIKVSSRRRNALLVVDRGFPQMIWVVCTPLLGVALLVGTSCSDLSMPLT